MTLAEVEGLGHLLFVQLLLSFRSTTDLDGKIEHTLMPRNAAMKTIKLPVRFGRFLGRKLDPRRRESLEESLRIGNGRLEEQQRRLDERAARRDQAAAPAREEQNDQAEQTEGRRRIRDWAMGFGDVIELGDLIFRLVSIVVRGLLRVVGGVLEGLSIFDI